MWLLNLLCTATDYNGAGLVWVRRQAIEIKPMPGCIETAGQRAGGRDVVVYDVQSCVISLLHLVYRV